MQGGCNWWQNSNTIAVGQGYYIPQHIGSLW